MDLIWPARGRNPVEGFKSTRDVLHARYRVPWHIDGKLLVDIDRSYAAANIRS